MWMIFMDEWMMSVNFLGGTAFSKGLSKTKRLGNPGDVNWPWCFSKQKNEGIFQQETRMWFGFWLWGEAYKDLMEIRFVGSTPEN